MDFFHPHRPVAVIVCLGLLFLISNLQAELEIDANGLPILPAIPTNPSKTGQGKAPSDPGRAQMTAAPSSQDKETEFSRYKAKVHQAVGARWYKKVQHQIQVLSVGKVRVQYTIYANGSVTTKVSDKIPADLQLLMAISVNSIREAAPFPPFSATMSKNLPAGSFTDEFSFQIYGEEKAKDNGPS